MLRFAVDESPSRAGRPVASGPRRRAFAAGSVLLGLVAALVALEVTLRVFHSLRGTYSVSEATRAIREGSTWIGTDDPELVYVNRTGTYRLPDGRDTADVEAHGVLRPDDVVVPKPPGTLRVAVIGDSVGAGMVIPYGQRFITRCERGLAQALARPVELLNCCVDGYGTTQEARLLETSVAALEPDAVVLVYCMNDPAVSPTPRAWFKSPEPPASFAIDLLRSGLNRALSRPDGQVPGPGDGPVGRGAKVWTWMYDPAGESWPTTERGFDRIASWCGEHHAPLLVTIMPLLLPEDPRGESTASFRGQVASALAARGVDSVDLQAASTDVSVESIRLRSDDIYHLNAAGHRWASYALYPSLLRFLQR